ncbi:MAG TPA: endolytic transglycosylase MltG [bacterium]|nr:endolytic transglycosylase MltG [bacterium]
MKKWWFISLVVVAAGWVVVSIVTLPPRLKEPKLVEIPEKATAGEIAKLLKEENIIRHASWFLFLTNRWRVQEKLQAGIYEFSGRTALKTVIRKLVQGQIALIKITVPEGATCRDIGAILERRRVISQKDFEEFARKRQLEGFLFPDTYLFPVNVSVETVVNRMLENFHGQFSKLYGQEKVELTAAEMKKVVTVASIVEKEAETDSERPVIASVLYNRLKKRLPLQVCATVEYALGKHKARLSHQDLKVKSPYNTYLHRGLPPGPICNPGKKSLQAALKPARTDFLFFVTRGDGTHHFSRTFAEHAAAIKIYLDSSSNSESQPAVAVKDSG